MWPCSLRGSLTTGTFSSKFFSALYKSTNLLGLFSEKVINYFGFVYFWYVFCICSLTLYSSSIFLLCTVFVLSTFQINPCSFSIICLFSIFVPVMVHWIRSGYILFKFSLQFCLLCLCFGYLPSVQNDLFHILGDNVDW